MTIQQIVRDVLERAIEDGLASRATPEMREAWEPQQFSAEDLSGCVGLLAAYLRERRVEAGVEQEPKPGGSS